MIESYKTRSHLGVTHAVFVLACRMGDICTLNVKHVLLLFFNVYMNVYKIINIIISTGYAKMPVFGKRNRITVIGFKLNKSIYMTNAH